MKKLFIELGIVLSCFISLLLILFNGYKAADGYGVIWILPITFLISYVICRRVVWTTDYVFTTRIFFGIQFLRYIVSPVILTLAGNQNGSDYLNVSSENIKTAIILMAVEIIIVSIIIAVIAQRKININRNNRKLTLGGSYIIYIIFAIFALVLFIYFYNNGIKLVNFLTISVGTSKRIGDITDTGIVLARQVVVLAVLFVFCCVASFSKNKYDLEPKGRYVYLPLIIALFSIGLIIGERRSAQIYTAVCSFYILSYCFPKQRRKIFGWIFGLASVVILYMSIYKFANAFLYDSYAEALEHSQFTLSGLSNTLQSYFAGPQNIGTALEFSNETDVSFSHFLFDFGRSTVPVSFLLKGLGETTSVMFNNYIYHGAQNAGHVLSATGYGYTYGGLVLFCWPMILNVCISFFCEKMMRTTKYYEMAYIWAYCMLRFIVNFYANPPALVSAASIMIFTGVLAVKASELIKSIRRPA